MSYNNPYSAQSPLPGSGGGGISGSREQARSKLFPPGIALIVVGSIGLLVMGAYFVMSLIVNASGEIVPPPEMNEAERTGFYVGVYGSLVVIALNTLLQILIILGGVAMLRAKGHALAFTGAVLSVIPCLSSSICILGIPFGIWALVVLSDSNVKRVFE